MRFSCLRFLLEDFKVILIFKICGKIDLKINWYVKTPLHGHKRVTLSGLRAPDRA